VPLARLSELAPAHQPSNFGVRRARSQVFDHSSWDMPVFEGFHSPCTQNTHHCSHSERRPVGSRYLAAPTAEPTTMEPHQPLGTASHHYAVLLREPDGDKMGASAVTFLS